MSDQRGRNAGASWNRGVWSRAMVLLVVAGSAWSPVVAGDTQPERVTAPPKPPVQADTKPAPAKPPEPATAPKEPAAPAPAAGAKEPAAAAAKEAAAAPDKAYMVSRFVIDYKKEHENLPLTEELLDVRVELVAHPDGFTAPDPNTPPPGEPTTTIRLRDVVEGPGMLFRRSALNRIGTAISEALLSRGLMGVVSQIDPADIGDPPPFDDLRQGKRTDLHYIVWTAKVAEVRSIASGERLASTIDSSSTGRVNPEDGVHRRIRERSPLQPGGLVRKDLLDDFVFRLNRHPGRRVDVAVAPGGESPESVTIDYLVGESKPWSLYAQLSNTGSATTSEWRERFGFVHNQLSGRDDILRLDYVTGNFKQSNAVLGSYELPIVADRLRAKVYGSASEFTASDVGQTKEKFKGNTWSLAAELTGTVYQHQSIFVDGVAGVRFSRVFVDNTSLNNRGQSNFLFPYLGVRGERYSDVSQIFGSAIFEFQSPYLAGTASGTDLDNLGRQLTNESWTNLKFEASASTFLEPLFDDGTRARLGRTLAHEVGVAFRGQSVLNDHRVIPNEEDVAGGLYTVRGYPESILAGDNVALVSAEYRFHLPHALSQAAPGHWGSKQLSMFSPEFKYQPSTDYGRTDWDLILKAFFDAAEVSSNNPQTGEDRARTIAGAGLGVEFQWRRNVSARIDWGVALSPVDDVTKVDAGDNRFHFVFTVLY